MSESTKVYFLDKESFYVQEDFCEDLYQGVDYTIVYVDIPDDVEDDYEYLYEYFNEVELGTNCNRRTRC